MGADQEGRQRARIGAADLGMLGQLAHLARAVDRARWDALGVQHVGQLPLGLGLGCTSCADSGLARAQTPTALPFRISSNSRACWHYRAK